MDSIFMMNNDLAALALFVYVCILVVSCELCVCCDDMHNVW